MGEIDEIQSATASSTDTPKVNSAPEEVALLQGLRKEFENSAVGAVLGRLFFRFFRHGKSADQSVSPDNQIQADAHSGVEPAPEEAIKNYEQQFADLQVSNKPSWDVVKHRLTADGNKKLKLAMALESTVIFGVDSCGKVLFSDGGDEVPESTKSQNFYTTTMKELGKEYELFDENLMRQWEAVTGRLFVRNTRSWLKSEDLFRSGARCAYFFSNFVRIYVGAYDHPDHCGGPRMGARRLLRV